VSREPEACANALLDSVRGVDPRKGRVAAHAARIQGSRPYASIEAGRRGAQYGTACRRLILIPVATRLSPHTARLRKGSGKALGTSRRGSAADFANAVVVLRDTSLRDHRMRQGEKILVVEDSLPAGRNDRRFATQLRPGAGRSGRQGGARTSAGPRTRDTRRGFVLRSAPGERSHPELPPRRNGLPTTITRE
jgi:hypothetical protein